MLQGGGGRCKYTKIKDNNHCVGRTCSLTMFSTRARPPRPLHLYLTGTKRQHRLGSKERKKKICNKGGPKGACHYLVYIYIYTYITNIVSACPRWAEGEYQDNHIQRLTYSYPPPLKKKKTMIFVFIKPSLYTFVI